MNEKQIQIKERSRGYFTKGFFFLTLMTLSLLYALYPVISARTVSGETYYYALGGGAFAIFTGFFAFLLYKEFKPDNAFLLNAHGFTDIYNVGKDVEIEWTNVASVKVMGNKEAPFLGISLEDSDIVMSKMSKNKCEVMRENIEEGLPAILVSHSDIRIPVSELKDLFTKFIRESRILEKDTSKKQKSNPFTTDDVLRAFGKLPEEDKNEDTIVVPEENQQETNEVIEENVVTVEDEAEVNEPVTNAEIIEQLLVPEQNVESEEVTEEHHDDSDDDMPQEIKDILAMAKSSKITELEKMLSDNQTFSIDFENEVIEEVTEDIEKQNDDIVITTETNDDEFIVPDYTKQTSDNEISEEVDTVEAFESKADEIPEEVTEGAVEEVVEDVTDNTVEDVVADTVEDITDDTVEDVVVDTVEDVIEEVVVDDAIDSNEEIINDENDAVTEDITEESNETIPEAQSKSNDIIRTNIPDLHIPEEFFEDKDPMSDTQEIKMGMNIETVVNNAFDEDQFTPVIDFSNIGDFDEPTIIEPQDEQEYRLDIEDSDGGDENDGELGFITDLD